MKTIELKASLRGGVGKSASKGTRKSNLVPAVVYGDGAPQHIALDYIALEKALYTPETYIVKLDINGTQTDAIMRQPQFHPVTDRILHVDFIRVEPTKVVEVDVPVKLTGTAAGVIKGGILQQLLRRVNVRGVAGSLPENVTIDVSGLELGKTLKVSDMVTDGYVITNSPASAVATVNVPRSAKDEAAATPAAK